MTTTDEPAEFDGNTPGVLLMTHGSNTIARLPLSAWPALQRWYAFPDPPPIQCMDDAGQLFLIPHASVAYMIKRDLDASVAIEARECERAWSSDE